jgi:hypothetical protein
MASNIPRKNRSSGRTSASIADDMAPAPRRRVQPKSKDLRSERDENTERMEHLELVIATASAAALSKRASLADYLPPLEEDEAPRQPQHRPQHRRQLERRQSASLMGQIVLFVVLIAAALGILNQRFHLWSL